MILFVFMSCMFCLFFFQVLDKLDLEVLDSWIFSELAILYQYLTWRIKQERIPLYTYSY